jgi:hypothetical protein
MISHALTIVVNELNKHLSDNYGTSPDAKGVILGNIAEGIGGDPGMVPRGVLAFTIVNIREEKSLKNLPNTVINPSTLTVSYENPPVFLNFLILITATHDYYKDSLVALSRAIRFFQSKNVFIPENVDPLSITSNAPKNQLDMLESFKLIFDGYSPSLEEVNHLWGILGGKQYPFILYTMRLLDLKFASTLGSGNLIVEIKSDFSGKDTNDR